MTEIIRIERKIKSKELSQGHREDEKRKKKKDREKRIRGKGQKQKANHLHSQVPALGSQLCHMQPGDLGQVLSPQTLHLCNEVRARQPAVSLVCFQDQIRLCGQFYITGRFVRMEALQMAFRGWMRLGRPGPQDKGNENLHQW